VIERTHLVFRSGLGSRSHDTGLGTIPFVIKGDPWLGRLVKGLLLLPLLCSVVVFVLDRLGVEFFGDGACKSGLLWNGFTSVGFPFAIGFFALLVSLDLLIHLRPHYPRCILILFVAPE
jgi:hypothetical protein